MLSWQEQYLTSKCSKPARYCSCHLNKKISSRHHVISSMYLRCFDRLCHILSMQVFCSRKENLHNILHFNRIAVIHKGDGKVWTGNQKIYFKQNPANSLNMERSYKRQGHAPLRHFIGSLCNGGKPE